jgi:hypothetical protein
MCGYPYSDYDPMPLTPEVIATCGGLLTVAGVSGLLWKNGRKLYELEQIVNETVPQLVKRMDAHERLDEERFDKLHDTLQAIASDTKVTRNDVQWLKRQQNEGHG